MGLDTSHDCWHGAYSSFNNWRRAICVAAGWGALDNYSGFGGPESMPEDDVLTVLLDHSDCEGEIDWRVCYRLADRLEALLPKLPERTHLPRCVREDTEQFIAGLRRAHADRENVEFH
jgi:hypothetical protein